MEFDGPVEVLSWGRNDYTVLRLEQALEEAARAAGTRRVEGTIDGVPVNVGANRADVLPGAFMYAGKGMLRRLGIRSGDVVSCRLRPADPNDVPLADDVDRALAAAGRLAAFQRRRPAERRRLGAIRIRRVRPRPVIEASPATGVRPAGTFRQPGDTRPGRDPRGCQSLIPWQRFHFAPLPQEQGSLRPRCASAFAYQSRRLVASRPARTSSAAKRIGGRCGGRRPGSRRRGNPAIGAE